MNIPAAVGTLRVSDSARAAVRSGITDRGDEVGFDNLLRLDASLAWPTAEVSLVYGPRLGLADDIERSSDPLQVTFLHVFEAGVTVDEERYTLALRQTFSIGEQSFGQVFAIPETAEVAAPGDVPDMALTTTDGLPAGTGGPVPLESGIPVWSANSTASLMYRLASRWRSNLDAGYGTTGGNGATAELSYPRLQTVDAGVGLTHDWTARHEVGGVARGQRGWSDRSDFWFTTVAATWRMVLRPETNLELRAGAGYRDVRESSGGIGIPQPITPIAQTRERAIVPIGGANLTHEVIVFGGRARYVLSVGYEPTVDLLTARLQDRLTALASASLASTTDGVTLSLSGSQSFPTGEPDASRFLGISLALTHEFADWIGVELGGQLADQTTAGASATVWAVYLGLGAELPAVRF